MRTVRTKIYKFKELSKEAQSEAIENLRYLNVDLDWWNNVYYDAENIGLKITSFDLERNKCVIMAFYKKNANIYRVTNA